MVLLLYDNRLYRFHSHLIICDTKEQEFYPSLDVGRKSKGFPKSVLRINLYNIQSHCIQLAGVTVSYKADDVFYYTNAEKETKGDVRYYLLLC